MTAVDVAAYLDRLQLPSAGAPSAAALARLHAAHVERVPFETLDRPTGVDPYYALERILHEGRGGVCYHLNGAFWLLLDALGYQVTMHPAGVQSIFNPTPVGAVGTHNVLMVSGLPGPDNPDGRWVIDVGSGEGFHHPLPLRTGTYRQGEFTYRVRPSDTGPGCWRIDYDERESCIGIDFAEQDAKPGDFADLYERQADNEMEIFFRYGWVKRHHAGGFDELVGCLKSSVDAQRRTSRQIGTQEEYFTALREVFGLALPRLTDEGRTALWNRVHETWTTQNFLNELPPVPSGRRRRGTRRAGRAGTGDGNALGDAGEKEHP
jgi:N-hydroxyarylamine O-acetyltransferase